MTADQPKSYASESNHWYRPDGMPCHEVPCKSRPGEFRNTTLRDARKLGLYPSVSGILSIQAKPGLDNWKKEQVAKAAWEIHRGSRLGGSTVENEDWISFVLEEAESSMSKARDLGTEIHGAIERWMVGYGESGYIYETQRMQKAHSPFIEAAVSALRDFGAWGQPFRAERSFASPMGYGGCLDFCTDTHIADFKCCDSLSKRLDYLDRLAQLAAYSMGVHGKLVKCANVFISTSEPGQYLLREWSEEELEYGWRLFLSCKYLWEVSNKYEPALSNQTI